MRSPKPEVRRLFAHAVVLALVLAAGGCSSSDPIVLTVGSEGIPLSVFQTSFWEVSGQDTAVSRDTAGVRTFLETYIEKEIMENLAAQYIPVFDEEMLDRVEGQREDMMQRLLNQHIYGDVMTITDAQLEEAYEKLKTQFHIREIRVGKEEAADRIAGMIREGGVFAKIAARESEDPDVREKEGDRGWVTLGQISLPVYEAAEKLETGEVSPVIRTSLGFHIIQLEGRRETDEVMPFEEAKEILKNSLSRERIAKAVVAYNDELMERYQYKTVPENVIWISNWLRDATSGVPRGQDAFNAEQKINVADLMQKLDEEDILRTLATSTVDSLNVNLLLVELGTLPSAAWPTFDSPEDVMQILRNVMLVRFRLADARRLKLDENPSLLWQLQKKRDVILTRQFYLRHVRPPVEPTVAEVRDYYDEQFGTPTQQCRPLAFRMSDQEVAAGVSDRLRRGDPPDEVFAWCRERDSTATWTGTTGGSRFYSAGELGDLAESVFSLEVGGVSDPLPFKDQYMVFKLLETREKAGPAFHAVADQLKARLWRARSDERLKEMLDAARDSVNVEVNEAALEKLQLNPPRGWRSARQIILGIRPEESEDEAT